MTTTGPNAPGTMQAIGTGTGATWTNPNNAKTSDNTYALVYAISYWTPSRPLIFSNFGFGIPTGDTIDGVEFNLERNSTTTNNVYDLTVALTLDATITTTGSNQAMAGTWGTSETTITYGGPSNTWGASLSPADVNAAGFGVVFAVAGTQSATSSNVTVDFGAVTIYHSAPGGDGPAVTTRRLGLLGVG